MASEKDRKVTFSVTFLFAVQSLSLCRLSTRRQAVHAAARGDVNIPRHGAPSLAQYVC